MEVPLKKRFNGDDGISGAAEYKVWKRWAPAALTPGGMPPEALGLGMYTLLDGLAALEPESIEIKDMCTDGGEELVFRELEQRNRELDGSRSCGGGHGGGHGRDFWTENHEQ